MALPTPRKKPFTEREKDVLLSLLKKYADIIENKRTDSVTVLKKKRVWARITEEYNSCPYVTQESTMKQLEKAWKNLKAKERTFRLADYMPRTLVNDTRPMDSGSDGMGPHFLLEVNNPYALGMWHYEKEQINSSKDNGEMDKLSDVESWNEEHDSEQAHHIQNQRSHRQQQNHPQLNHQVEQNDQEHEQQQYAHISRHGPTRIGDIEITAMNPRPNSQRTPQSSPEQEDHGNDFNTSQPFMQQDGTDIRQVEMHVSRDEELHELKIQLASAQLAKVKAETELQTQLLKEQLRKAKAEADLAELLLQRSRSVIVTQ